MLTKMFSRARVFQYTSLRILINSTLINCAHRVSIPATLEHLQAYNFISIRFEQKAFKNSIQSAMFNNSCRSLLETPSLCRFLNIKHL